MAGEQIFISYRRDGGEFLAKLLFDELTERGYTVFVDVEALRSGGFNTQLFSIIDGCTDFILLLSPGALDRCVNPGDWVLTEITRALEKKKNVVPIRMRGFRWPGVLPKGLECLPDLENEEFSKASASEYFNASVNRLCSKLLVSKPHPTESYALEEKELYPIKTPLFCGLKKDDRFQSAKLDIEAAVVEAMDEGPDKYAFRCPEFVLKHEVFSGRKDWYNENEARMKRIAAIANELRFFKTGDSEILTFYADAVIFSILLNKPLCPTMRGWNVAAYVMAICVDLNVDLYNEAVEKVEAWHYPSNWLMNSFVTWVNCRKSNTLTTSEREKVDKIGAMLFDLMLECVLLLNDLECVSNVFADKHPVIEENSRWILAYYKWLRQHGIFLPKHIQEKLYKFVKI